jgi:two-component system response regulator
MIGDSPDILIVDAEKTDIEFMLKALNKHKLTNKVKVLQDGGDAPNYLFAAGEYIGRDTRKQPKVIILNLKLPKVSGFEILRTIRSNEMTRTIPVVVFTSSNEDWERIECYRLGANSYIVKPVYYDSFVRTIAEIGFYWTLHNAPPSETYADSYYKHRR